MRPTLDRTNAESSWLPCYVFVRPSIVIKSLVSPHDKQFRQRFFNYGKIRCDKMTALRFDVFFIVIKGNKKKTRRVDRPSSNARVNSFPSRPGSSAWKLAVMISSLQAHFTRLSGRRNEVITLCCGRTPPTSRAPTRNNLRADGRRHDILKVTYIFWKTLDMTTDIHQSTEFEIKTPALLVGIKSGL